MTGSLIRTQFSKHFSQQPIVVTAPGRTNLMGEHVDYNEGLVLPVAIDKHFTFAVAANNTDRCQLIALDFNEQSDFPVQDVQPEANWSTYFKGVVAGFQQKGLRVPGINGVFSSTVPTGAGLSSSAALCSGFAFALNHIFGFGLSRLELAFIAQYSEHRFAGVQCGIMDQYASLFGEENAALLLDCRSVTHETVPLKLGDYTLLLIDTKVKHSLASSAYNQRRAACEEGVRLLAQQYPAVRALRDVTPAFLHAQQDALGEEVWLKCRFVVEEIDRVKQAAALLRNHQWVLFGKLMFETHWGLSKAYEVSCAELDWLVTWAEGEREHIAGARMVGGGFGGCTLNLVKKDSLDYVRGLISENYFTTFGTEPDFYLVHPSDGVRVRT
jgi:galactokinase